jgi:hypothetical protein
MSDHQYELLCLENPLLDILGTNGPAPASFLDHPLTYDIEQASGMDFIHYEKMT